MRMPSVSYFWAICHVVTLHHARFAFAQGPYVLAEDYSPDGFFDKFRFYTGADPTNGFVQYVNRSFAADNGLISTSNDFVTVGVDHERKYTSGGPGRPSVRLETLQTYTHGLFVLSLNHMPYGCGTWPAFWSLGPQWPHNGEIDIIEGVNQNVYNLMSLHTDTGCTIAGANETGTLVTNNCDSSGSDRSGCGVLDKSSRSYGVGFNDDSGGLYAMEWTSASIKTWFFPPDRIPRSILNGAPDPSKFGKPAANFQGSCEIDSHFANHYLIFDITFCGDYAGNVYSQSSCPNNTGGYDACTAYVADNPADFSEAYWSINYLRVYVQQPGSVPSSSSTSLSSVTPVVATASGKHSSLAPPGMGVDSSSSRIGSSTLSLPSSTLGHSSHRSSSSGYSSTLSIRSIKPLSSLKHATSTHRTSCSLRSSRTAPSKTSNSGPSSFQTSIDTPKCHSIFKGVNDVQYRIYCNTQINGPDLQEIFAHTFANCIHKCDESGIRCIGSIFSNVTSPPRCILKKGTQYSKLERPDALASAKHVFAAVRLFQESPSSSGEYRIHTSVSRPVTMQSIYTITKNDITGAHMKSPIYRTAKHETTIEGASNIPQTTVVTVVVRTTVSKCPVPLSCPIKQTPLSAKV